jgi:hypothetical protein
MIVRETTRSKESWVFRRLVPIVGLIAVWGLGLSAAPAWAQVNIDQGKSAAEMFNGDCATCHKSAKGLANKRNSGELAGFLREHYTSSAQQAASLAAYVLGAGAGPAPGANLKPGTAGAEAKPGEVKPGDKNRRPEPAATADAKPEAAKPPAGKRDPRAVTASRGARQEPETPPPAPAAAPMGTPETAPVATAPAAPESAAPAAPQPALPATAAVPGAVPESSSPPNAAGNPAASPSAPETGGNAATASGEEPQGEGAPAENAPVPRDDIPD